MEEDQKHSSVFKICKKSFFSEGHFRRHVPENSWKKIEDCNFKDISKMGSVNCDENRSGFGANPKKVSDSTHTLESSSNRGLGLEDYCDGGYGLRENPKGSWKGIDVNCCEECGKGFISLRALTAHLKSHLQPQREIICKECGRSFGSMRALCGHMRTHPKISKISNESVPESQSDHEMITCPVGKKRSKMSYISCSDMSSGPNVSVIDEVEEAAMCLFMLSRGWRSSENEAVGGRLRSDACKSWMVKKMRQKVDSQVQSSGCLISDRNGLEFDELGCGLINNNTKEADLDVLVDGFRVVEEYKNPELVVESMEVTSSAETGNVSEVAVKGFGNASMKTNEFIHVDEDKIDNGIECLDEGLVFNSSKEGKSDVHSLEMVKTDGNASGSEIAEECEKEGEYKCRTCNEVFYSYRALVVHQASHKSAVILVDNIKSYECPICFKVFPSSQAFGGHKRAHIAAMKNAMANQICSVVNFESYECPICLKTFPSGQALGGHKRAHYNVMVSETNAEESMLIASPSCSAVLVNNIKTHECPICLKAFSSSQGLGRHKKVHIVPVSEMKFEERMLMKHEVSGFHTSSDLALPAQMMNVMASRGCGGIGSDLKHVSVLISN